MKIRSLKAKNFWSYEDLSFTFDKGLCLIEGLNHDEGGSNAAGKSAILNALCFSIFGDMPKKIKVDSIIRRDSDNGCIFDVEFEDNGVQYRIERGRSPNFLKFYINGQEQSDTDNKKTQYLIEKTIGVTYDIFLASVYFSQNSKNFLHSNDDSKKSIMSDICDLKLFEVVEDNIKRNIKDLYKSSQIASEELKTHQSKLETLQKSKTDFLTSSKFFDEDRAEKIKSLNDEIKKIDSEILKYYDNLTKNLEPTYIKSLEEINSYSLTQKGRLEYLNTIDLDYKNYCIKKQSLTDEIDSNYKILDILKKEPLADDLGFQKDDLLNKKLVIEDENKNLNLNNINYSNDLNSIKDNLKDLEFRLNGANNQITNKKYEIELLVKAITEKEKQLGQIDTLKTCPTCLRDIDSGCLDSYKNQINDEIGANKNKIALINELLNDLGKDVSDFLGRKTSYESVILGIKSEIDSINKILAQNSSQLIEIESDLKLIDLKIKNDSDNLEKSNLIAKLITEKTYELAQLEDKFKDISIHLIYSEICQINKHDEDLRSFHKSLEDQIVGDKKLLENLVNKRKQTEELRGDYLLEVNLFKEMAAKIDSEICSCDYDLIRFKKNYDVLAKQISDLEFLQESFSNKGIKSYVFDSIVNELNIRVNEYLKVLFSNDVRISFLSETENKNGDIKQKFSTKFFMNNKEIEYNSFSGGEDRRLQFAVNLSLADICSNRVSKNFNVLFFDESFDGLDFEGKEKCMLLLQQLSEKRDCILVIDHSSEFQSSFENVVRVEKKNRISTLIS